MEQPQQSASPVAIWKDSWRVSATEIFASSRNLSACSLDRRPVNTSLERISGLKRARRVSNAGSNEPIITALKSICFSKNKDKTRMWSSGFFCQSVAVHLPNATTMFCLGLPRYRAESETGWGMNLSLWAELCWQKMLRNRFTLSKANGETASK